LLRGQQEEPAREPQAPESARCPAGPKAREETKGRPVVTISILRNWYELSPYGIEVLSGEWCEFSYRILCDVTAKGREAVANCLGIPGINLPPPWTRGSKGQPHVGSFRAAPELFVPLAVFCLLEAGASVVYLMKDGTVLTFEGTPTAEELQM